MENNYESIMSNPDVCREIGKRLYYGVNVSNEEHIKGLKLLIRATQLLDAEACYLVGRLLCEKRLQVTEGDPIEVGLKHLCTAANKGFAPARTYLNIYCDDRYKRTINFEQKSVVQGPLIGFDGKRIKLKKSGLMTPVDAKLEYVDGVNILTLSANIAFFNVEHCIQDPEKFYQTILSGFEEWAGEYEVFGGQKLKVKVELTTKDRKIDNVWVMPMSHDVNEFITDFYNMVGTKRVKERVNNLIGLKRSAARTGQIRWSVRSRKFIMIQSDSGKFNEYDELKDVAKHEFGHVLGLGDLYKSEIDGLKGVDKGTFSDLDGYYITDNGYNLVMCYGHGPISNNDIEMVVLAFSQNRMQNYQPQKIKDKISEALGKGN